MVNTLERTKNADAKPAQSPHKKPFAGRKALVSTIMEETGTSGYPLQAPYDTILVSGRSDTRTERTLSEILGAHVTIVTEKDLKTFVGQDEADRFIAGVEAKKKSR